tara:strand:- start:502 stop:621 length:120 start_codon:yes stop_codon:yes gene_type:complete
MSEEKRYRIAGNLPDMEGTLAEGATVPEGDWQAGAMPET